MRSEKARGPRKRGAPVIVGLESAGPQKMRSEKARGPRTRGGPVNAEPENAADQKTRGSRKRFYNENRITKAAHQCLQLHYKILGL